MNNIKRFNFNCGIMGNECCSTKNTRDIEAVCPDEVIDIDLNAQDVKDAATFISQRWKKKKQDRAFTLKKNFMQRLWDSNYNLQNMAMKKLISFKKNFSNKSGENRKSNLGKILHQPNATEATIIDSFPEMTKQVKSLHDKLKNTDFTKYLKDEDNKLPKLGPYK